MKMISTVLASALAIMASQAAAQSPKAVTDCPLRNMPFSAATPMIDILLSDRAKAAVEQVVPGRLSKLPADFMGTRTPTFAAIMDLNAAASLLRFTPEQVAEMDRRLRQVPVTAADKVARCARYDNERPALPVGKGKVNILVFDKVNGFYHKEAIPAVRSAMQALADSKGWSVAFTDKGGSINPATLRKFDAIVWSNVSGDVLTLSQRRALEQYVKGGGGFVALHGSGGDSTYFWKWYADELIGAYFTDHPTSPQFQDARLVVADARHPIAAGLPSEWRMKDEWYSFRESPRKTGANVVLTIDESTYKPVGMAKQDLRMGADHPIAWSKCVGRGRAFYSALGHRAESYTQPQTVQILESAISWAVDRKAVCAQR